MACVPISDPDSSTSSTSQGRIGREEAKDVIVRARNFTLSESSLDLFLQTFKVEILLN